MGDLARERFKGVRDKSRRRQRLTTKIESSEPYRESLRFWS